jgi:hypothetical protein
MTTATLPRLSTVPELDLPDEVPYLDYEVATAADRELGYRAVLVARTGATNMQRLFSQVNEAYVELLAAGIHPLDPRAVERYKDRVSRRQWLKPAAWQGLFAVVAVALFVASFVLPDGPRGLACFVAALATCVPSALVWSIYQPANWQWQAFTLHGYQRQVPMSVLAVALKVRQVLPDAQLVVVEFARRERVADPFLVARYGGGAAAQDVYLAAWDEPTFEG